MLHSTADWDDWDFWLSPNWPSSNSRTDKSKCTGTSLLVCSVPVSERDLSHGRKPMAP